MEVNQPINRVKIILYRLKQWKNHLLPPVIASMLASFPFSSSSVDDYWKGFYWFASLFCISVYGYWVNDWSDRNTDLRAGKPNFLIGLTSISLFLGAIFFTGSALLLWLSGHPPIVASILFMLEWVCFTLYCLPVIRLKSNPIFGPLCDTHYTHILPVFFTILFFLEHLPLEIIICLYLLLLMKGIRNILLHQVDDRKTDKEDGLYTFPIRFGPLYTIRLINRIFLPLETLSIVVLLLLTLPFSYIPITCFSIFILLYGAFLSIWHTKYIGSSIIKHFLYFMNDLYEFWLPYIVILSIHIKWELKLLLLLVYALLFTKSIKSIYKVIRKSFNNFTNLLLSH